MKPPRRRVKFRLAKQVLVQLEGIGTGRGTELELTRQWGAKVALGGTPGVVQTPLFARLDFSYMSKPQTATWQSGFTTAEKVVYPMVLVTLVAFAFGFYHNSRIEKAVSAAVDLGLVQQAMVEQYFATYGQMPQSEADINLSSFTPEGILVGMDYRAGELGVPAADKGRTGTLRALVDMTEFGTRFEDVKSGFLLIARAQDDNSIQWDCMADTVTVDALAKRYLPESCSETKDEEAEED